MEEFIKDSHIGRYLRRVQLGLRFLAHGARAHTTCRWTGLTPDQLVTVRRRSGLNSEDRLRGPSPSSFGMFFRSQRTSSQAALFVSLCRAIEACDEAISIEVGERLCDAFEIFREWIPEANLEFEQAILLVRGVVEGKIVALGECKDCSRPTLLDRMGDQRKRCSRCLKQSHGLTSRGRTKPVEAYVSDN
jgi:hypothetical protein